MSGGDVQSFPASGVLWGWEPCGTLPLWQWTDSRQYFTDADSPHCPPDVGQTFIL